MHASYAHIMHALYVRMILMSIDLNYSYCVVYLIAIYSVKGLTSIP